MIQIEDGNNTEIVENLIEKGLVEDNFDELIKF